MLLLYGIRHDYQKEVQILRLSWLLKLPSMRISSANILEVVVIDCFLKGFYARLVAKLNYISIININVEASLLRQVVKPIVQILPMLNVLLEAEDCPLPEMHWLVNDCTEDLYVV